MATYDFDNSGTILVQDVVRAFKKLGMLRPEAHMPMILVAGGASENDERVDYVVFTQQLESQIVKQIGSNNKKNEELIHKVAATLQAKKMSPFEFFCTLDVNSSGRISKIELKTGMQALGIAISTPDYNELWKLIKKPVKKLGQKKLVEEQNNSQQQAKGRRGGANDSKKQEIQVEDLSYFELLQGMNNAGCFKF